MKRKLLLIVQGCFYITCAFAQNDPNKILAEAQRKIDSVMKNDPNIKKYMNKGNTNNTTTTIPAIPNIPTTISPVSSLLRKPDTSFLSKMKLPPKNTKILALLPTKTITRDQLINFVSKLKKTLIPELQQHYSTEMLDVSSIGSTDASNAAAMAWCVQRPDVALELAIDGAEKDVDDPNALNNLSGVLTMCGVPFAAVPILDYIKQSDPANSTVDNNLGQAYIAMGDIQKGINYLLQALAQSPYHPNANLTLARIAYINGDHAAAKKYCENSLRGGYYPDAWTMLKSIDKKASLMELILQRYKQPDYFNPHKYPLPEQCRNTDQLKALMLEYQMYRKMLTHELDEYNKKLKVEHDSVSKNLANQVMKAVHQQQTPFRPFGAFGIAVLGDIGEAYADKIKKLSEYDSTYTKKIDLLDTEYEDEKKQVIASFQQRADAAGEGNADTKLEADMCKAQNELANKYLPQFADLNEARQQEWIEQTKNYFNDYAFWCYIASLDVHSYREMYYQLVISYLDMLEKICKSRFIGCAKEPSTDEQDKDLEFEEEKCPYNSEIPIPAFEHEKFEGFIAKVQLDCEKMGIEFGEGLIFNAERDLRTGEVTIAFGAGVSKSIPIVHLLELGAKMQFYVSFWGKQGLDVGVKYEVEMDIKGMNKPEQKAGWVLGINSGGPHFDTFAEGVIFIGLSEKLADALFPVEQAPQINKNIKMYNNNNPKKE